MFLRYPVMDLARAPRRTARKKGSGYENELEFDRNFITIMNNQIKNKHVIYRLGQSVLKKIFSTDLAAGNVCSCMFLIITASQPNLRYITYTHTLRYYK
jgi:hypothetical protein